MTGLNRRKYSRADVEEVATRYRTWGRWGDDDQLGAANRITPATVAAAAAAIKRGVVFSLALPMDNTGPMTGRNGRVNPQHVMLRDGGDMLPVDGHVPLQGITDDAIYMPLQASTQWDALCHFFHNGQAYNARGRDSVTSHGAQFNSITNLKDRAVGRGVLLDLPKLTGRPWLETSEAIQAEDLARCAEQQGVEIGEGDYVLIRTGQLAERRSLGGWGDYAGGPAAGLGLSAADYLCPRGIVGVATDTWGVEVLPYETDELIAPLHVVMLVNAGIYLGEMWDLEALADDCAADGVYEFFLSAAPLTITGAVGSPINPLAIK